MTAPEESQPSALLGQILSDRYRVDTLLGEGGMGAVYLGEHQLMRKRVAIKVLHPEMMQNTEVVQRFEREAMAGGRIDHPNVAAATDFGRTPDGSFFLVLEYIEGRSLRAALEAGALPADVAVHVAYQVAQALGKAHGLGIVHRDLKPENVMLVERDGDPNFVKVLDFGIAKVPVDEVAGQAVAAPGQGLTRLGVMYGTPEYMAPEQALGQEIDARADLYALGIVLYEMLCGSRPFLSESVVGLVTQHVTAKPPPLAPRVPGLLPALEAAVLRLLEKSPDQRFAGARELADDLARIAQQLGGGYLTPPVPPAPLAQRSPVPPQAQPQPHGYVPTAQVSVDAAALAAGAPGVSPGNYPTAVPDPRAALLSGAQGSSTGNLPTALPAGADGPVSAYLPTALPQAAPSASSLLAAASLAPVAPVALSESAGLPALPEAHARTAIAPVPEGLALPAAGGSNPLASVEALLPADVMATLRAAMPPSHRNMSPLVPLGAAAIFFLLVGLTTLGIIVSKVRSHDSPDAPDEKPGAAKLAPRKLATPEELTAARTAGPTALQALSDQYPDDVAVLRAWVVSASDQKRPSESMLALGKLAALAPDVAEEEPIRAAIRAAAEGPQESSDQAFSLLEGPLGAQGADYLYELWTTKEVKDKVQERAGKLVTRPEVRDRASPPVRVLVELKGASGCDAKKKVFPHAKEWGDQRALKALQPLTYRRGCGFAGLGDCWSCMRSDGQLDAAMKAIDAREKARAAAPASSP
jgi:eukaryotic-like serine/threonine-protein kinase